MTIRDARQDDAHAIATVHVETWRAAYAHALPAEFLASLATEPRETAWRQEIESGSDVVVAEQDGRVVGFASVGPARGEEGAGELCAIYVLPSAWGTGAGRELMAAAVARLRERGHEQATLWVLEDNPRARRFYEAGGWRLDGGRTSDTIGGVDAVQVRYRLVLSGHGRA